MIEARIKYLDGLQCVGEASSSHAIVIDGAPERGGRNTGLRPTELFLISLGSCSGMSVMSILKKKRQNVRGLDITVKGEKAKSHPKRFTRIDMEFVVRGQNISEDAVKKAVGLSMKKYCSVKATLDGSVAVNASYKIVG